MIITEDLGSRVCTDIMRASQVPPNNGDRDGMKWNWISTIVCDRFLILLKQEQVANLLLQLPASTNEISDVVAIDTRWLTSPATVKRRMLAMNTSVMRSEAESAQ